MPNLFNWSNWSCFWILSSQISFVKDMYKSKHVLANVATLSCKIYGMIILTLVVHHSLPNNGTKFFWNRILTFYEFQIKLLNFYFSTKWKLDRQDLLKWLNLNWNGISKKHWPQCTSIYSFHQKIVWNVKPHENHDRWMKIARIASQKYISLGANHKGSHQFLLNL